MKLLGVGHLIGTMVPSMCVLWFIIFLVTNAAGALNQEYAVGDLVILNDVRLQCDYLRFI